MRSLSLSTLTTLAVVGSTAVLPIFNGGAIAAPAKHRVARSACPYISRQEVIAAMLRGPLFTDPRKPIYINGKRLCVDPHPYAYTTDPIDGSARLLWRR